MNHIKVDSWSDIPDTFIGVAEFPDVKYWLRNREIHREDGPASEWFDGHKQWHLKGKITFVLPRSSQPFVFVEETDDKQQIKVLTSKGTEFWPNLPGLKELAET